MFNSSCETRLFEPFSAGGSFSACSNSLKLRSSLSSLTGSTFFSFWGTSVTFKAGLNMGWDSSCFISRNKKIHLVYVGRRRVRRNCLIVYVWDLKRGHLAVWCVSCPDTSSGPPCLLLSWQQLPFLWCHTVEQWGSNTCRSAQQEITHTFTTYSVTFTIISQLPIITSFKNTHLGAKMW